MFTPLNRPLVFIGTLGNQPQVITLALDELLPKHPFDEICIIHTDDTPDPDRQRSGLPTMHQSVNRLDGEFILRHTLPAPPGEHLWEAEYRLATRPRTLLYRRVCLQRPASQIGQPPIPIRDVETRENSRAAFRTIYQVARRYKEKRAIIHFSIAGGRKSMSVFGMAAAQLLFGPGDYLWHVVSKDEFVTTRSMHDPNDQSRLVPIRFIYLNSVITPLGMLIASSDPFDAIAAQENLLQLLDLRRKEEFLRKLDFSEYQILIGVTQGLTNAEIGRHLEKKLSAQTVANKLTDIYQNYMMAFADLPEDVSRPGSDRIRTFLAAEFGAYFQQRGEKLI